MSDDETLEAFAELKELLADIDAAQETWTNLHELGPGDADYDEMREVHSQEEDPDACTRAEIATLVTCCLPAFLSACSQLTPFLDVCAGRYVVCSHRRT